MDNKLAFLQELSEVAGVSGFESRIKKLLTAKLSSVAEVSGDKIGSVIFKKQGTAAGPKIMVASHMDEIGFMVKTITKEGFIRFTPIGGWWEQVMLGQRVTVLTAKGDIPGVIGSKPPHILTSEERSKVVQKKDMYIDISAADDEEAKEWGVRPGDIIAPWSPFAVMANEKFLLGKAWDNRIGCAVMADVLEALQEEEHQNTVYGVGTVQEEVGLRGAKTSVGAVSPDIAFAMDTCIAGGTPGVTDEQASAKLGKGVGICFYDARMLPHVKLRDFVIGIAEEQHIPYQLHFTEGGGTDAGLIHLHQDGVPSLALSIPTRYIHSHNSIIHRDDYEAAVKLLVAVIRQLDSAQYEKLLQ
jgi:endoglucanase